MKSALIEELQKRGWDMDGKPLKTRMGYSAKRISSLNGTLDIIAKPMVAIAEWTELQRQMGLIVEKLEEMCEKPPKWDQVV